MLEDLFVNMTILITFISLGSQVVKKYNLEELYSIKVKIVIGIVSGMLGIILMMFAIKVHNDTIIDFRNIAIIMPTVFGGGVSVFISGIK